MQNFGDPIYYKYRLMIHVDINVFTPRIHVFVQLLYIYGVVNQNGNLGDIRISKGVQKDA